MTTGTQKGRGAMKTRMSGTNKSRMDVAKDALIKVLGQVSPTTNVGVLVFDGNLYVMLLAAVDFAKQPQRSRSKALVRFR